MENEIKDIASRFEAIKIAMTQDKNGFVLKLSIHPNDAPEDVLRDPVGTRYGIALVRIDEHENPVASQQTEEGLRAVRLAAALCHDPEFQAFMMAAGYADDVNEAATIDGLRSHLGIVSRAELKTNRDARMKLAQLRDMFVSSFRR